MEENLGAAFEEEFEKKLQELREYIENFVQENKDELCSLVRPTDETINRLKKMISEKDALCKLIFACGNQEAYTIQYSGRKKIFKSCVYYILQGETEDLKEI